MVGSSFPYSEFLPEEGQARGVQIDIDGRMLGIRYPMEVNLVGDSARDAARAAPAAASARQDRSWREQIEGKVARLVEADRGARACSDADPINPQRVFWELSQRLPDGAILTVGLGLGGELVSRATCKLRAGHDGLALGHARDDGARACRTRSRPSSRIPTGRSIALVGDGAMQMNGNWPS